jgi:hypothetical protein
MDEEECLRKRGITDEEQNGILLEQPMALYAMQPGLREIKQVKLWSIYLPCLVPKEYRDECRPPMVPCEEVILREKKKKKAKGKLKRDEKKEKGKLKVVPPKPIVAETTASSMNDPQELTTHGTSNDIVTTAPSSPLQQSHEEVGLKLCLAIF